MAIKKEGNIISKYIYEWYSIIWKVSCWITFSAILINVFFIKIPLITVIVCIVHLLVIIPTGIIAKKADNQFRNTIKDIVMMKVEK